MARHGKGLKANKRNKCSLTPSVCPIGIACQCLSCVTLGRVTNRIGDTMQIIQAAADVKKAIASIKGRAKKLDKDIHTVAVSCLHHADQHGDVTLMQELILSMGKSQRRNAVIAWACAYGKFQADDKGKNVEYNRTNTTDMEGAIAESPWEFKPEAAFKPFNMKEELTKLIKRAEKAASDSRNDVPKGLVSKLAQSLEGEVDIHSLMDALESIHDEEPVAEPQAEAA